MIACGQCFVFASQVVAVIAVVFYPLKCLFKGVFRR